MDDYIVLLAARGDGSERIADPGGRTRALMSQVEPFRGACSVGEDHWEARVRLDAADAAEAGAVAAALVHSLAAKAGLPPWPVVRLDAVRSDLLDEEPGPAGPGSPGSARPAGEAGRPIRRPASGTG